MTPRDDGPARNRRSEPGWGRALFSLLLLLAGRSCAALVLILASIWAFQAVVAGLHQVLENTLGSLLAGLALFYQRMALAIVLAPPLIVLFLTDPWYAVTLLLRLWVRHRP